MNDPGYGLRTELHVRMHNKGIDGDTGLERVEDFFGTDSIVRLIPGVIQKAVGRGEFAPFDSFLCSSDGVARGLRAVGRSALSLESLRKEKDMYRRLLVIDYLRKGNFAESLAGKLMGSERRQSHPVVGALFIVDTTGGTGMKDEPTGITVRSIYTHDELLQYPS